MGYFLLSAETTFSAAHTLPGAGACEQMHGHNWRVRITVQVDETEIDAQGMGVDFRIIDEIVGSSVSDFDHTYLNNIEPFNGGTDCPRGIPTLRGVAGKRTAIGHSR